MTEQDLIIQDLRREVTQLKAELEWKDKVIELAQRNEMQWISVEDQLPESNCENSHEGDVLCYIPPRDGVKQHGLRLGKLCPVAATDGSKNFWGKPTPETDWTVWGWSYFEKPVVTHWMPLPCAPKEDYYKGQIAAYRNALDGLAGKNSKLHGVIREICRRSDTQFYDFACEYCTSDCDKRNGWCARFEP